MLPQIYISGATLSVRAPGRSCPEGKEKAPCRLGSHAFGEMLSPASEHPGKSLKLKKMG